MKIRTLPVLLFLSVALSLFVSSQLAFADSGVHVGPEPNAIEPTTDARPPGGADPVPDQPTTTPPAPVQPASAPPRVHSRTPRNGRIALTLNITTTDATVEYGQAITLAGALTPAASSAYVVERHVGSSWTPIASGTTGADGHWSTTWTPSVTSTVRVRLADNSVTSAAITIVVRPRIVVRSVGRAPAFVGVRVVARVYPSSYRGRVVFAVRYAGAVRASAAAYPSGGKLVVNVPNNGVGNLRVDITLPSTPQLARATSTMTVGAPVRLLQQGSRGADVAALLRRMKYLNFHIPGMTRSYNMQVSEVVMAFHKAHRMTRTYTVDRATWKAIATSTPMRPRFTQPARHIEVDKTRQILMIVRKGRVIGTLHVSTGATGNTPLGRWHIYQKGGSHLYKFMAFVGNFGIHGYVPVPPYPASHGCVREPMWAASWTYAHTNYGDEVHIYT